MPDADSLHAVDRMFQAFADRNRLRILHLLAGGELCVGDLVRILAVPQPRVSRHLARLRAAGLVRVRKQGRWSFYALAPARHDFQRRLLECLDGCFAGVPELEADRERGGRLRSSGGCCASGRIGDERRAAGSGGARRRTAGA